MIRYLLCLALLAAAALSPVSAQDNAPRQYYSAWTKHSSKPYYYRHYYYKKSPTDSAYSYQYGIYYPSRGKRVYMYNPQKKLYWGYWEGETYALLPADKQRASIEDIPAEAFPKLGKPPRIPEAEDNVVMEAPPSDFPKVDDLP